MDINLNNDNNNIILPEVSTIGATEKAFRDFFVTSTTPYPKHLIIDMSRSQYIEVATLMFLISYISSRVSSNLKTIIKIPIKKEVRDFFRLWNFPIALSNATNLSFVSFVDKADKEKYFGENESADSYTYKPRFKDQSITRLVFENFFSIITLYPLEYSRTRLVSDESMRWETELIKSILSKLLDGPESYIASRIIFESMTNATRHSGATLIQTASKFNAPFEEGTDKLGHFTVSIWDNGKSIIDTLSEAVINSKEMRLSETPKLYYYVKVINKDAQGEIIRERLLHSGSLPNKETSAGDLLLFTTFPGITSDITGKDHSVHADLERSDPMLALPGMGLYVLMNTAIDIFGGSISFRSKDFFMNIKKAKRIKGAQYRAKIQYYDSNIIPVFKGNLITVRLPLKKQPENE